MRFLPLVLAALVGCSSGTPAPAPTAAVKPIVVSEATPAGPKVENPQYLRWSKFKPGTVVVHQDTSDNKGKTTLEQIRTSQIKSVTDDRVVVEVTVTFVEPDGKRTVNPSQNFNYDHWFVLQSGATLESFAAPPGVTGPATTEEVELLGRKFTCRKYKSKGRVEAGPTESVTWLSDDVPGGLLKSVNTVLPPVNHVTTTVATEVAPAK